MTSSSSADVSGTVRLSKPDGVRRSAKAAASAARIANGSDTDEKISRTINETRNIVTEPSTLFPVFPRR